MENDERMKVMKLVQDGKITPEEGDELITLLEGRPAAPKPAVETQRSSGQKARWMKIRLSNVDTGKLKGNIRVPIGLVNAGMKIGARFSPELQDMDLTELMDAIKEGETGLFVDVTDDDNRERVEVFLE
jgi:hypothetical protein